MSLLPYIEVIIDIDSDISNRKKCYTIDSYGMNWKNMIRDERKNKNPNTKVFDKQLKDYLNENYHNRWFNWKQKILSTFRNSNNFILEQLSQLVWKPYPINIITITFTSIFLQPYNSTNRSFLYAPFWKNNQKWKPENSIRSLLHEVLHMFVHYYYQDYIINKWLTLEQFHILKESQTIILNESFKNMITEKDIWYESHQYIRKDLENFRKHNKNFDEFVDYWIDIMKK